MSTAIQWTDETWNPTVGCSRVSPGCDNCYAIRVAGREMQPAHVGLTNRRTRRTNGRDWLERLDWTGEVRCLPDRLDTPLRWKKPRRVFVDSMSDLFHPSVPEEFVRKVWDVMAVADRHTFQILTKRPQRMAALCNDRVATPDEVDAGYELGEVPGLQYDHPLPNVWLGTSVENQQYADLRIPHLLATPAAVRFLSIEPLLGPVDLHAGHHAGTWELPEIDWVIVGGESGPSARPMEAGWAEDIVAQCLAAGVAVFVKQLGSVLGGKQHHDIATFPKALRVREWPEGGEA